MEDDEDNFKDANERDKCQTDYNEVKKIHGSILNSARHVLGLPRSTTPAATGITPQPVSGAVKIEETLKSRELLSADMNLEEANLWFDAYQAHIGFNKNNMSKLDIKVRRAMLNACLDPRIASALRTHQKIKAETEIDTPNTGCLDVLREIFLEKNPLWLRRHWYFQCIQTKDETVEQWWSRKLDKARECDLRNITAKEIGMLELIRGIDNQALRREFHYVTPYIRMGTQILVFNECL